MKDYVHVYIILGWQSFSLSILNVLPLPSELHGFRGSISCPSCWGCHIHHQSFFCLFFVLSFDSLTTVWLSVCLFQIIALGICWASSLYTFRFLTNFGSSLPLFFQILYLLFPPTLSPGIPITHVCTPAQAPHSSVLYKSTIIWKRITERYLFCSA